VDINTNLGLCNRLRTLCSFYDYAKINNEKLYVNWEIDEDCPGHFLDYFEPLDGVVFNENNAVKSNGRWMRDRNPFAGYNIYKDLTPKKYILDEIKILKKILKKNYTSIHVRRTDHNLSRDGKNVFVKDSVFFDFLNKSNCNIYLATDNFKTQEKYFIRYKKRMPFVKFITGTGKRQTPLIDAVIDIYMCIESQNFLGTPWSSFTSFIKHNKNC